MEAIEISRTVEQLRERIRKLEAEPRSYVASLRTGVAAFDGLLPSGGLPLGHVVELWGEPASGRLRLALRAVAAAQRAHRLCAYVDGPHELYPPAAAALGVELESLLIVRPRAPGRLTWAAAQLARSGAFACVVLDLTHTGVRLSLAEGKRLIDAAAAGGTLLLLLTPPDAPGEGTLRLRTQALGLEGLRVDVIRSRQGALGAHAVIPWAAFGPELPASGAGVARTLQPPPSVVDPVARRGRLRAVDPRNGGAPHSEEEAGCSVRGIYGQRPGRDAPFPPLGGSLGL